MEKHTKKELLILTYLRQNSRLKLTKLSKLTGIPVSTIFDRIKARSKLIQKHTTLINFQELGYTTRATITLKTKKEQRQKLQEHLINHSQINSTYRINNGYDFLIEGIFRHIKELEDFLETLEEKFVIKAKQVYYIIEDLKREAFMSRPENVQMIMEED
jgi:DNA-binding Lrp family transcriptional regulator